MATFALTMGSDTVAGGPENDTSNGTAATLNAGDSLTGGAGTDVLALIGSGTFRVDQLATFTGFERIRLDNATTSYANLMLGSQAIEVDATGSFSIGVNSPSNWNSSNIINGDAQTGSTANLTFYNNQAGYPPLPVTYDLTSNTFSRVNISGWSDNITLLVNNADTADVPFFNGYGQNVKLATSGSTLDLSHTKVSGFSVNSTNTLGTAFTVGDLGTAFQIAGGAGQDTITALGFIFTPDQRNTIFAIASVEKIVDQGGTYLKDATTADTFHGGSGNDIFNVDNAGDVVIEDANAGIDTVNSPNSIAPSRTLGRGSRSKGARREQRLRPRASRSTRLPGAALNAASLKQPQRQSSALSGSSGRKMSWRVICDGQTIAARNGRARSRSNTTRPAPLSGIRSKNEQMAGL